MPTFTHIQSTDSALSVRTRLNDAFSFIATQRDQYTSDRFYYVRTSGNDSNNGLSYTTAFRTWARALDEVASIDGNNLVVNILGQGYFTESIDINHNFVGVKELHIYESGTFLVNPSNLPAVHVRTDSTIVKLSGISLGGLSKYGLLVENGFVRLGEGISFNQVTDSHIFAAGNNSRISLEGSYSIDGAPGISHISVYDDALFSCYIGSVIGGDLGLNIPDVPPRAWFVASRGGKIVLANVFWPNSYTGRRFIIEALSSIYKIGGSTLPGNLAGTTSPIGIYVE